jgi:hypothetical protein
MTRPVVDIIDGGIAPSRGRLTDVERRERALSEADFQRQVTDLATALGWTWCHWRALRNGRGFWQVPVEGPLGAGWPDLTLLRVRDRRLVFAELKRELGTVTADQAAVLAGLGELAWKLADPGPEFPSVEAHLWRPSDLREPIETSAIYAVLR